MNMDKYTFEVFASRTRKKKKEKKGPFISIGKNTFGLSTDFVIENALSEMTRVVLYYDEQRKIIAFEFLKKDPVEPALKVSNVRNSESKTIYAVSFYLHHGIDPQIHKGKYKPYVTILPNLELVYYIKLKEERLGLKVL